MTSTFATPEKAIVFYSFDEPMLQLAMPAVHDLCQRGCSGTLMLEKLEVQDQRHSNIVQLLGLSDCSKVTQMKQIFQQRFGKLRVGLVSRSREALSLGQALELPVVKEFKEILDTGDLTSGLKAVLLENSVDFLFVDMTSEDVTTTWTQINAVLQDFNTSTPTVLKTVITRTTTPRRDTETHPWSFLVPKQSCTIKNGTTVDVDDSQMLLCAYLHEGSTRRDKTNAFCPRDVIDNGCNGSILAWHFLVEIGQKLGYVPKYGA